MTKISWIQRKKILIFFLFFLVFISGIGLYSFSRIVQRQNPVLYEVYQVRPVSPLLFDGRVHPEQEQEVYVDQSLGVISDIEVGAADIVDAGTVLFSYTNHENQRALDEQERLYLRLNNSLSEENTNLANAQIDLETAKSNLSEANNEIQNYTTHEQSDFGFDKNLEDLHNNLADYESDKLAAEVIIDNSKLNIRELQEQLENNAIEKERLKESITVTVKSKISGIVEINESVANRLESLEEPLIRIISEEVIVESSVSEYDFNRLSEGSSVDILLLSSEQVLTGEILNINSRPFSSIDNEDLSSRYRFTVRPEEPIQYGFSVQISYQDNTIHLPKSTLLFEDEKSYVYIYEEGSAYRREVSIEEEGSIVILKKGVSIDEKVIINPLPELENEEEIVIIDD